MTTDEFCWLDRCNYVPLETGDLQLWATVLQDRVELNRFLNDGQQEFVAGQFKKLQAAPLTPLGFKLSVRRPHPASQKSVKPLTSGHHFALSQAFSLNPDRKFSDPPNKDEDTIDCSSSVDELVQQGDLAWRRYAHLQIDLHATDKVLEEDFRRWLTVWRARVPIEKPLKNTLQETAAAWGTRGVVPYFDMQMLARLSGKEIPRPIFIEKLTRTLQTSLGERHEAPSKSALDELRNDMARIFRSYTVRTILNAITEVE
ncbi:DUF6387 family protein [Burkholderia vietnamiensis]|uniref:DUF6387 family protein n=1 Tax=Burkholderia vietnamiensis TaxID=60552 RepID=UPI0006235CE2|nr:DUF6387 family protein [Burkholderia vietnamiensis]KVE66881.1 hypothetical protein WI97_10640 [Burkholderia vietnamiensis]